MIFPCFLLLNFLFPFTIVWSVHMNEGIECLFLIANHIEKKRRKKGYLFVDTNEEIK